jgi:hypothetical protein
MALRDWTEMAVSTALLIAAGLSGMGCSGPGPDPLVDRAQEGESSGDAGSDPGCPSVPATSCSPMPSYASRIEPLLQERCTPCHFSGGVEDSYFDFSSYANVSALRTQIRTEVSGCIMPPPTSASGQPTMDERTALLAWLACGAPNN